MRDSVLIQRQESNCNDIVDQQPNNSKWLDQFLPFYCTLDMYVFFSGAQKANYCDDLK